MTSVSADTVADIAPTQIAPMPDLAAAPLVMACRTWKKPHAIAMSQNCTLKTLSQFNVRNAAAAGRSCWRREPMSAPEVQRPVDELRLSEERRQALGEVPTQAGERRPGPLPWRRGRRL